MVMRDVYVITSIATKEEKILGGLNWLKRKGSLVNWEQLLGMSSRES